MKKVYDNCCGIDVHKKIMVACFIHGKEQEIREFGATTRELLLLADWLSQGGCQMAAMESTASYWKPLYNVLETSGLNAIVVNAQHMKAVPGRKTDVKDSEWIADLLQHGLLQPSFIPNKAQRELRELVSYRKSLIKVKTAELNRLQKMLEGANIKLSGTIADIDGVSGRNLLNALLSDQKVDETKLDEMRRKKQIAPNLKASNEQLLEDLNGMLTPLQKKMMKELLSHLDELIRHIKNLDDDISENMNGEEKKATAVIQDIPGIAAIGAQQIISVIGTDMSRFPTDAHISSWAGLCPGNNESAKKRRSGRSRKGNAMLRTTLITCAHAAVRNKNSFFYAEFQRVSGHRGSKRAYVAVAHSMLKAIYHILKDGVVFKDLGADYYNQFNKERKINSYLKKLRSLGWQPDAMNYLPA
ncbi:MAG: IS110 family transposase [Blautia sp.]|nr:IS110 family transposase [Blautia sp.]